VAGGLGGGGFITRLVAKRDRSMGAYVPTHCRLALLGTGLPVSTPGGPPSQDPKTVQPFSKAARNGELAER
jgi:hypothetical protein